VKEERNAFKVVHREVSIWKSLDHQNIVPLLSVVYLNGHGSMLSMVSLFMPNGNLDSYLRSKSKIDKMAISIGIVDGLCYLHEQGIAHGDLKPSNILVDNDNNPRLCDFGLSRMMMDDLKTTATHAGGTLRYMAPELLIGEQITVSKEADIYALAMTCYNVVTGTVPFPQIRNDYHIIVSVVQSDMRPIRLDDLDEQTWGLLCLCWTRDPDKRPLITDVKNVMESIGKSSHET